jgi:HEAT repeat protein
MDKRIEVLVESLQDKDRNIRSLAAEAIDRLEMRDKLDFFDNLLTSGAKLDKLRATYALGNLRGQQVMSLLIKASKDPVEDVRAAAIRVLGRFSDRRLLPHLIECLKDPSPIVERGAIEAIYSYRDPQLVEPLMQMLKSKDPGVVEMAIEAVGRSGDKKVEPAMLHFAVKGNTTMRYRAIRALGIIER